MPTKYSTDTARGVGLRNVDKRLRKTYGSEHGLQIQAHKPHGTAVTLRIPMGSRR